MAIAYGVFINCIGLFVKPLMAEFGFSNTAVSAIMSFESAGVCIGSALAAWFIEKTSAKHCIAVSAILMSAAAVMFSRCTLIWSFYICSVMIGISVVGMSLIPVSVLVKETFDENRRGTATSIAYMGSGIGGLILNPVLGFVIEDMGWKPAFAATGFLPLCIILPLVFIILGFRTENKKTERRSKKTKKTERHGLLRVRRFWLIAAGYFVFTGTSGALVFYIASFYVESGYTARQAALIVGVGVGCIAAGKLLVGVLSDRVNKQKMVFSGILCLALCFGMLCFIKALPGLIVPVSACYGIGIGAQTVLLPIIVGETFGKEAFTEAMGLLSTVGSAGSVVAPLVLGSIIDASGSYIPGWIVFAIVTALAALVVSANTKRQKAATELLSEK